MKLLPYYNTYKNMLSLKLISLRNLRCKRASLTEWRTTSRKVAFVVHGCFSIPVKLPTDYACDWVGSPGASNRNTAALNYGKNKRAHQRDLSAK